MSKTKEFWKETYSLAQWLRNIWQIEGLDHGPCFFMNLASGSNVSCLFISCPSDFPAAAAQNQPALSCNLKNRLFLPDSGGSMTPHYLSYNLSRYFHYKGTVYFSFQCFVWIVLLRILTRIALKYTVDEFSVQSPRHRRACG